MMGNTPARRNCWIGPLGAGCILVVLTASPGEAEPRVLQLSPHTHNLGPGPYHPGPYYSQQHLQEFGLGPGQRPLFYRLVPYQHYGRHRLGQADDPLTTGSVASDRFPYRYDPYFQPVHASLIPIEDECIAHQKKWEYRQQLP